MTEIRNILQDEYKRLAIQLELFSDSNSNSDRAVSPFNKKMEAASQITELDQRLGKARIMRQQMVDIKHTLEKIEKGTYGLCDNCGRTIAEERLKVAPQASLCLECKTKQHRNLLSVNAR